LYSAEHRGLETVSQSLLPVYLIEEANWISITKRLQCSLNVIGHIGGFHFTFMNRRIEEYVHKSGKRMTERG